MRRRQAAHLPPPLVRAVRRLKSKRGGREKGEKQGEERRREAVSVLLSVGGVVLLACFFARARMVPISTPRVPKPSYDAQVSIRGS